MVTQYFLPIQQETQLFQSQYIEGIFIVKISWCSLGIITVTPAICPSVRGILKYEYRKSYKISTPSFSFGLLSSQLLFSWLRFAFLIVDMLYWFKLIKIKSLSKIAELWKNFYWGKLRLCEYLIGMNYCSLLKKKKHYMFYHAIVWFWVLQKNKLQCYICQLFYLFISGVSLSHVLLVELW